MIVDIRRILAKVQFGRWRKKAAAQGVRSELAIQRTINTLSSSLKAKPLLLFARVSADVRLRAGCNQFLKLTRKNICFGELRQAHANVALHHGESAPEIRRIVDSFRSTSIVRNT